MTYECIETAIDLALANNDADAPLFQGYILDKTTGEKYDMGIMDNNLALMWYNIYGQRALAQHPIVAELPPLWAYND